MKLIMLIFLSILVSCGQVSTDGQKVKKSQETAQKFNLSVMDSSKEFTGVWEGDFYGEKARIYILDDAHVAIKSLETNESTTEILAQNSQTGEFFITDSEYDSIHKVSLESSEQEEGESKLIITDQDGQDHIFIKSLTGFKK